MPIRASSFLPEGNWPALVRYLREITRRGVDGTVNMALKHTASAISDSAAIANTTTETNFSNSYLISPSQFAAGKIFRVSAGGLFKTTGQPTMTFKFLFGTSVAFGFESKTAPNNANNQGWWLDIISVCRTTGSAGTLMSHGFLYLNQAATPGLCEANDGAMTIDTTINQRAQISLTWGTASPSNTAIMKNFVVMLSDY